MWPIILQEITVLSPQALVCQAVLRYVKPSKTRATARLEVMAIARLTQTRVEREKRPGFYADGGNLYLRVAAGGSRQWVFRYARNGRQHDMGLGSLYTFSVEEA